MLGQIKETAEAAKPFAEMFGLQGLVALACLASFIWGVRFFLAVWRVNEERRIDAEIDLRKRITDAQIDSYNKHIGFVDSVQDATQKISHAMETIAGTNELKLARLNSIDAGSSAIQKDIELVKKTIRSAILVAADCTDHTFPDIEKRLRKIAEDI
jgi:hypothetical protein